MLGRRDWRSEGSLLALAVIMFFTNLGAYPLFDEDEPKNAVCGREMFLRGDLIVPTFNEDLRTDKPILIYWVMLTSFKIWGGVSEFAARFGSATASTITILLALFIGRRLYGQRAGWLGALVLLSSMLFAAVGRAVTPDPFLICSVMLTFAAYLLAIDRQALVRVPTPGRADQEVDWRELVPRWSVPSLTAPNATAPDANPVGPPSVGQRCWALFNGGAWYAAMGVAVLAKGPVGFVLPGAIIGCWLLLQHLRKTVPQPEAEAVPRPEEPDVEPEDVGLPKTAEPPRVPWKKWLGWWIQLLAPQRVWTVFRSLRLELGVPLLLLIAAPWYAVVGWKTDGAWLRGFFGDHNVGRFMETMESHNGPIVYHVLVLFAGMFPWSVYFPFLVWRLWGRSQRTGLNAGDRLLLCWAGVWIGFFSLASTKLPNYVLPAYPAVALLMGRELASWWDDVGLLQDRFWRYSTMMLLVAGIGMVAGVAVAVAVYFPGEVWLAAIGLIPILGSVAALFLATRAVEDPKQRIAQPIAALCLTAWLLSWTATGWGSVSVGQFQESPVFGGLSRKLVAEQGQPLKLGTYGYFTPSLVFYAQQRVERLDRPDELIAFVRRDQRALVVMESKAYSEMRGQLPEDLQVLERHRRFLRPRDLVLVSRNPKFLESVRAGQR